MKKRIVIGYILAFMSGISMVNAQSKFTYVEPKDSLVRERISTWQDLKFGMFIHWGTYSMVPVMESWSICPEKREWVQKSRPENFPYIDYLKYYEGLYKAFNPVNFNPDKWAEAALDAGMKYVVFTTKHHDGFNMFDTQQSDYKVTSESCPFHNNKRANISSEVFNAFRDKGLKAGAYFSIADWHHNDYWWQHYPPVDRYLNYDPELYPEKFKNFVDFLDAQVEEITNGDYGDIELMWLDLCEISETYKIDYPWERLASTARKKQPGIIMVARGTHGEYENYYTAELKIPEKVLDYPWECCFPLGQSWAHRAIPNYKSVSRVIEMLITVVSRGGNFLLGVGPGPDGEFLPEMYDKLAQVGDWMEINGEGIYGSKPVSPYQQDNIFYTTSNGCTYAFVILGDEGSLPRKLQLNDLEVQSSAKISILGSKTSLRWKKMNGGIEIDIPSSLVQTPPCKYAVCLKIK